MYLLNLSTNEESVLSSNSQDPTKFSLSWTHNGSTVYIEDFTPDNASPSITSLLSGYIQMFIEEDGVYYEKYRGKAIERPDLSVIASIKNKQNVYSENISDISNPKEGDITVQPSTYISINPEVTTSMGGGYISNTWNLSPWTDKTIKIKNASNGISSGVNVTYANNITEFINIDRGSNLEVVVTNVISASASGMSNANFNFYVAQEQPIKEYYNGEWIDRKLTTSVVITGLPTAEMNKDAEALAGIGITPENITKLSKGNTALIVKDVMPVLGGDKYQRMNVLYSYFYSDIYCELIFADKTNKYDILFANSIDPTVTITPLA